MQKDSKTKAPHFYLQQEQSSDSSSGDSSPNQQTEGNLSNQQRGFLRNYEYSSSQEQDSSEQQYQQKHQMSHHLDENQSSQFNQQQSSQEEDYQETNDYFRQKNRKLQSLQQESQEEDESIDYIEQRIKKLQRDLEDRLDRHKKKGKAQTKKQSQLPKSDSSGKIVSVNKPPIHPVKKSQRAIPSAQREKKAKEEGLGSSLPQTQINFKQKTDQKESGRDVSPPQPLGTKGINMTENTKENIGQFSNISKKKQKNPALSPIRGKKKIKTAPKLTKNNNPLSTKGTGPGVHEELKRMNRQITELKKQNKNLRQQLSHIKRRKKPLQQLGRLKELSDHDTKKIQKEFQLLKVLERLQGKLKNSIERKLGKGCLQNKQSKQAALLHKGIPSNFL